MKELIEKMREAIERSPHPSRTPQAKAYMEICAEVATSHFADKWMRNETSKEDEPITNELLESMGFKYSWPEFLANPEYRRNDEHPDGRAYVTHPGSYTGVMLKGPDMILQTKKDLIKYLSHPDRHKG